MGEAAKRATLAVGLMLATVARADLNGTCVNECCRVHGSPSANYCDLPCGHWATVHRPVYRPPPPPPPGPSPEELRRREEEKRQREAEQRRLDEGRALARQGDDAFEQQSWDDAIADYEAALERLPDDARIQQQLERARTQAQLRDLANRKSERPGLQFSLTGPRPNPPGARPDFKPAPPTETPPPAGLDFKPAPPTEAPPPAGLDFKPDPTRELERARLAQRAEALHKLVKREQDNIRNTLGFAAPNAEIKEWENLAADAQKQLLDECRDALIDAGFDGLKRGAAAAIKIDAETARKMIARLKSAGVTDPYALEAIKTLGDADRKRAHAKKAKQLIDAFQKLRDDVKAKRALDGHDAEKQLNAIASVIGWAQKSEQLGWFTTEVRVAIAAVYNNFGRRVSEAEIDRLNSFNEDRLKQLRAQFVSYQKHVQALAATRRELAEYGGGGP